MKMHEILKINEGKPPKNYKPGRWGEVVGNLIYLALLWRFLMHAKLFSGTPECEKRSPKIMNIFGLCKVHGFHGNRICDSRILGCTYKTNK